LSNNQQQNSPRKQQTEEEALSAVYERFNGFELQSRSLFNELHSYTKGLLSEVKQLRVQNAQLIEEKKQWEDLKDSRNNDPPKPTTMIKGKK
jgi:cell shape-determining protein MreC